VLRHLRRQVLRQRAQLGARVGVQFLAGDVVRQQRIIVPGTFLLLGPRPSVLAVARRPVGASALLGTLRTAPLEGPVPVPGTPFTPALEPSPALAVVTVLEPPLLRRPVEPALARTSVVTARPVVSILEPPLPRRPVEPALALAPTGTSLTPRATALAGPGEAAGTPFLALAALTAEPTLPGLALSAARTIEPPLTRLARSAARAIEPALTRPATVRAIGSPLTGSALTALPFVPPLTRPTLATALSAEATLTGRALSAALSLVSPLTRPALTSTLAAEPTLARPALAAAGAFVSPLARLARSATLAAEPALAGAALTGPGSTGPPIRGLVPPAARALEPAFTAVTARAAETTVAAVVRTSLTGAGTPIIGTLERTAGLPVITLTA
jgi:hypothetical protein